MLILMTDINKFLWMVRIGGGVFPDEVKESNYFTPKGEYKIGKDVSKISDEIVALKKKL